MATEAADELAEAEMLDTTAIETLLVEVGYREAGFATDAVAPTHDVVVPAGITVTTFCMACLTL